MSLCVSVCESMLACVNVCESMSVCMSVCESMSACVSACESMSACVRVCVSVHVTSACTQRCQISRALHRSCCFLWGGLTLGRCDSPLARGPPFVSFRWLSQWHLLTEPSLSPQHHISCPPVNTPPGALTLTRGYSFTLPASPLFCGPCCVCSARSRPHIQDT